MRYEHSPQTHSFEWHDVFRFPETVEFFLSGHRDCFPGHGNVAFSCSKKLRLLEIRQRNGWTFPVPGGE